MRISNQERRKIAAQLRESRDYVSCLPKLSLAQNAIDVFERMLECVHYESGNVFDHLADLIDRPTCDVRMGVTGHIGVCTRCGAMVEMRAAVFDAIEALPTRYCPNCGAEVIPHAERRD